MLPPFGLYARIDALLAGLLGQKGFSALLDATTLTEVQDALRRTHGYAASISAIESSPAGGRQPQRTDIERALEGKAVRDLVSLVPFASAEAKEFILAVLRGFEIEDLKSVVRLHNLATNEREADIEKVAWFHDMGRYGTLPIQRVREARTAAELVSSLAGTSFHRPLANAMPHAVAAATTFPMEAALDDDHLSSRWRVAGRLAGGSREHVRGLLGIEADLLSICWIYRSRFLIRLPAEQVLPRLPHFHHAVTPERARALAAADDPRAFAALLAGTPHAALLEPDGSVSAERIDLRAARVRLAAARASRSGLRFHLGQLLAFLWIERSEAADVGAIAECVHYGIDRSGRGQYLIGART